MADYLQGQAPGRSGVVGPVLMEMVDGVAQPAQSSARPVQAFTTDVDAPAASTAAVLTYAGAVGVVHCLGALYWSLAGSGTIDNAGVNLSVADGANTVFSVDVAAKGPGFLPLVPSLMGTNGNAMTVTLADPGDNLTAKVNARHYELPGTEAGQQTDYGYDFSEPYNSIYL